MENVNQEFFHSELECITGKIYNGDITPLFFDLIKEYGDLKGLYKQLTGKRFHKNEEIVKTIDKAPNFNEMFKQCRKV